MCRQTSVFRNERTEDAVAGYSLTKRITDECVARKFQLSRIGSIGSDDRFRDHGSRY